MREKERLQKAKGAGYKMKEAYCRLLGKSIIRVTGKDGSSYKYKLPKKNRYYFNRIILNFALSLKTENIFNLSEFRV